MSCSYYLAPDQEPHPRAEIVTTSNNNSRSNTNGRKQQQCAHHKISQPGCHGASAVVKVGNKENWIKIVYLTSASVLVSTGIIVCILLHLVIVPYLHERSFVPSRCQLNYTRFGEFVKCENKCSKDRSRFQCLQVVVTYKQAGQRYTAFLYEHVATLRHFSRNRCATSPCHKEEADNLQVVTKFNRDITGSGRIRSGDSQMTYYHSDYYHHPRLFSCFISLRHPSEALLYKFYDASTFWHCTLWPLLLIVVSLAALVILYHLDHCQVWQDDHTVIS